MTLPDTGSTLEVTLKRLLPLIALIVLTGCSDSGSSDSTISDSSSSDSASATAGSSDSNAATTDDSDSQSTTPGFSSAEKQPHDASAARMMAETFVRDKIPAEDTPVFQPDEPVVDLGAGVYKVSGYVDARSPSGKLTRSDFEVRLNWLTEDQWQCDYIKVKKHK